MKKEEVVPFMLVKHFKHELNTPQDEVLKHYYITQSLVHNCTTGETMVLYRALYGDNEFFVRTLDDFCSKVDKEKYPNIKQEDKFVETELP